jgi:hypothetical protein
MRETSQFSTKRIYQIKVEGLLDAKWSEWFDGFTITPIGENETLLVGPVCDQGALHGFLAKIRDLGLALLLVEQKEKQKDEK